LYDLFEIWDAPWNSKKNLTLYVSILQIYLTMVIYGYNLQIRIVT